MGCNCKRIAEFQEKYGEKDNLNGFVKFKNTVKRIIIALLTIPIMILTVPIIIIILSFQLLFGKAMGVKLPVKLLEKAKIA